MAARPTAPAPEPGTVQTVLGPVPADALGTTLVHEHLWSDMTPMLGAHGRAEGGALDCCEAAGRARWNPSWSADNYRLTDLAVQIDEIGAAARLGIRTFVDATPPALGRDPERLAELSRATSTHVVMGCGWYLQPTHDPTVAASTIDELATTLVDEIVHGVAGTGIRPGIIGEIGTGDPPTADELRCVRAAARAARTSGLALSVHLHPWSTHGQEVLDAITHEHLDPHRVLLHHVTTAIDDPGYLTSLLRRGANLGFDLFGFDHSLLSPGRYPPSDHDTVERIVALVADGWIDQLFTSQDVGVRTRLLRYGGWGYGHLIDQVVPLMERRGLGRDAIDRMLVANPARFLSVAGVDAAAGYGDPAETIPPLPADSDASH